MNTVLRPGLIIKHSRLQNSSRLSGERLAIEQKSNRCMKKRWRGAFKYRISTDSFCQIFSQSKCRSLCDTTITSWKHLNYSTWIQWKNLDRLISCSFQMFSTSLRFTSSNWERLVNYKKKKNKNLCKGHSVTVSCIPGECNNLRKFSMTRRKYISM
jgi:hypothetical protein